MSQPAQICAVIQAGRGRYNWAAFAGDNPLFRPGVGDHHAGTAQDLEKWLAENRGESAWWIAGEVGEDLADATLPQATVLDSTHALRRAGILARLAAIHLAAGHSDTLASLQPLYLRQP